MQEDSEEEEDDDEGPAPGEYEVERLIGIRWVGEVSDEDKEVMEIVDDDVVDEEELPQRKTSKKASADKEDEPPLTKGLEFKVSFHPECHSSVWTNNCSVPQLCHY